MRRATRENGSMTASSGPATPTGRRPSRAWRGAGLSGAIVAIVLVVTGSVIALGIADITPSSALPRSIAAGRVPRQTTPTTPPTTVVHTTPPTTTIGRTTHVVAEPTVRLQDDHGNTTNPNADDSAASGDAFKTPRSHHPHDD
jgi:hypothetical protein